MTPSALRLTAIVPADGVFSLDFLDNPIGAGVCRMRIFSATLMCLVVGCSSSGNERKPAPKSTQPWRISLKEEDRLFSELQGTRVVLLPSRAHFSLPDKWKDKDNNPIVYLRPGQLEAVANSEGEWATDYASVCNSIFPFDRCAVHAGRWHWGNGSGFGADIQLRVYVLDDGVEKLRQDIIEKGSMDVLRKTGKQANARQEKAFGEWQRVILRFELWYDDYGGDAHLDCYLREFGHSTIAACFMYSSSNMESPYIVEILNSFRLPHPVAIP
jgi:hypothetical protein